MSATDFRRELDATPALQQEVKRYLYVVMGQLAQNTICAHFHLLEARLARCLLMMRDRAHSETFHATHEILAQILGVRRVGITKAATSLQNHSLISYNRGAITIMDSTGLEAASCDCFSLDNASYNRIMLRPT
ncbi:Crp/Fnr family transcriptional regulator [Nitrincola alkalilacustris]|uniref:Crp/Fnr family transcriptional regulator n=1 Tax=Nitrincola alkalilacustris TaxID=1571224 RepID=UPI001F100D2B|nr:helix-turn-helix domain-containing protein [Nitrincola alkalilacustris]